MVLLFCSLFIFEAKGENMKIIPIEIIRDKKKKMGKFGAAGKSGELIKYKWSGGYGYAHLLSDNAIETGKEICIDTLYDKAEGFKIVEKSKESFYEHSRECDYYLSGIVTFVYKNLDKKELIKIESCGWEFFLGEHEINLREIELDMKVEVLIRGLELYEVKI